jgi:hypothetical protein
MSTSKKAVSRFTQFRKIAMLSSECRITVNTPNSVLKPPKPPVIIATSRWEGSLLDPL